jgi:hypothetical protein
MANWYTFVENSLPSIEELPMEIRFVGPDNYRVKLFVEDEVYYLWAGSYHHRMWHTQYDMAFKNEENMLEMLKKFIDTREVDEINFDL